MHDRLKTPEYTAPISSEVEGASNIERTPEVRVDFNPEGRSEELRSLEDARLLGREADERMSRREVPRSHSEINRDLAAGVSSNLVFFRQDKIAKVAQSEQGFNGGEYEPTPKRDAA